MFDNKDNTEYTDDLIKAGQEPIIIKEKDSSDKKFIYTILILLVILFIIALGIIGYLGSKFFNSNAPMAAQQQPTTTSTQNVSVKATSSEPKVEKAVVNAVIKEPKKVEVKETPKIEQKTVAKKESKIEKVIASNKATSNSDSNNVDITELENIVNESESNEPAAKPVKKEEPTQTQEEQPANSGVQQAIGAAASATGTKKLTQEEMAKIAKLVAMELAKAQAAQSKKTQQPAAASAAKGSSNSDANSEESLVKSLQEASTDTLQAQEVDLNAKVDAKKVKATGNKKVDTFNKVVVEKNNNADDEFAKLSSEIDSILAQDEVQQNKANKEITSQLQDVVKDREKEMRFIVVKRGDTLSSLAYRAYGRASAYVKIYKANPDLVKNPNRIYVGMRLRVPVDEEYKGNQQ